MHMDGGPYLKCTPINNERLVPSCVAIFSIAAKHLFSVLPNILRILI
jgi:hypothetical protein